ncbi:MAG: metal-dependent transcriptional regulator [Kiritimatiellae bacterium]|nr:metal-dependent transcriptional regulator [Kiritimatiellia bacterium]
MTQSLEDYLEAIHLAIRDGGAAHVRGVAKALGVKMPSVVKAVRELRKLGLVIQDPYSPIELTAKGKRLANSVLRRHTLLRSFLIGLGVSERNADRDACLMEHILSAETIDKIRTHMGSSE